ncbi:MAG: HEPN domain-containing protein [Candidatus Micrarchaeota archaeon]
MKVDELIENGLLKRIPPSEERMKKSLKVSERYLFGAKKTLESDICDMAIMGAYSSTFHAARAILFKDGFSERSHYAIYQYLKEKHKTLGNEYIETFNLHRKLRHSVAYGLDTVVGIADAEEAIEFAERFLKKVKSYLAL